VESPTLFFRLISNEFHLVMATRDRILLIKDENIKEFRVGSFLQYYFHRNKLYIVTESLKLVIYYFEKMVEVEIGVSKLPKTILFLDNIICALVEYNETLMAIFHHGSQQKIIFPSKTLHFQQDARLVFLNENKSDWFEIVPEATRRIFQIGSEENSSLYYDHFIETGVPNIEFTQEMLKSSILDCLDAAKHDFGLEPLISCVINGNLYLEKSLDEIYMTVKTIRVVSLLHQNGIPITYDEFTKHPISSFLTSMVTKRLHSLASKIGEYLETDVSFVWRDWAIQIVYSHQSDDEVVKLVEPYNDIKVCEQAFFIGKRKLTLKLLESENIFESDKMVLLLKMREFHVALKMAKDTLDPDLFYHCLNHMKLEEIISEFKDDEFAIIRDYYLLNPDIALEYYRATNNVIRLGAIQYMHKEYEECVKTLKDHPHTLEYKMSEQIMALTKEYHSVDCLSKLIHTLIKFGKLEDAKKTSITFGMSKKKFSWIQLKVYVLQKRITECESLALNQSQIEFLLDSELAKESALKWINKIVDYETKVEYYIKYGYFTEAATLAYSNENTQLLDVILSTETNPLSKPVIQDLINKLKN
jgi:hypothetical protein